MKKEVYCIFITLLIGSIVAQSADGKLLLIYNKIQFVY